MGATPALVILQKGGAIAGRREAFVASGGDKRIGARLGEIPRALLELWPAGRLRDRRARLGLRGARRGLDAGPAQHEKHKPDAGEAFEQKEQGPRLHWSRQSRLLAQTWRARVEQR